MVDLRVCVKIQCFSSLPFVRSLPAKFQSLWVLQYGHLATRRTIISSTKEKQMLSATLLSMTISTETSFKRSNQNSKRFRQLMTNCQNLESIVLKLCERMIYLPMNKWLTGMFQISFGLFHLVMNIIWALLQNLRGAINDLGCLLYFFVVEGLLGLTPEYMAYRRWPSIFGRVCQI